LDVGAQNQEIKPQDSKAEIAMDMINLFICSHIIKNTYKVQVLTYIVNSRIFKFRTKENYTQKWITIFTIINLQLLLALLYILEIQHTKQSRI
jgi:hypothetical protein